MRSMHEVQQRKGSPERNVRTMQPGQQQDFAFSPERQPGNFRKTNYY